MPDKKISRNKLYEKGLYIPTLWADTLNRGCKGFELEKKLSNDLLPLPIDHRYRPSDMLKLAQILKENMS